LHEEEEEASDEVYDANSTSDNSLVSVEDGNKTCWIMMVEMVLFQPRRKTVAANTCGA